MTGPAKPTPLAILLAAMHAKWERGEIDAAAALARAAAPYLHARASSRQTAPEPEPHRLSDAQLQLLIHPAGTGAAAEDPHGPG